MLLDRSLPLPWPVSPVYSLFQVYLRTFSGVLSSPNAAKGLVAGRISLGPERTIDAESLACLLPVGGRSPGGPSC